MTEATGRRVSIFKSKGLSSTVADLTREISKLYLADDSPWVIGYSGGKDSTAVTQLVWLALSDLPDSQRRKKPVYVITTDTLVENPIVAGWVRSSLKTLNRTSEEKALPFQTRLLEPAIEDSFWVNLIGKGYPAPRPGFRWCTERLKIKPASQFIEQTANKYGEAILLLGARKAESAVRSASLSGRERVSKEGLTAHPQLVNTLVYTPIEEWSNDDVWMFLTRVANPWGHSNKDLMALYRGATEDNECPVVVDTSTPSCGNSRFGCWVCTLVDQDKSMKAMIQNDVDKSWMRPLLDMRNELDFRGEAERQREHDRREFRRLRGAPQLNRTGDALVPGPYTQKARAMWLERLLSVQTAIRGNPDTPELLRGIELISERELKAIRRIWVEAKHEIEDLLPRIYERATGSPYSEIWDESAILDADALSILEEAAAGDRLHYETLRNLLDIEGQFRMGGATMARRGLFKELQASIESGFFANRQDALAWAKARNAVQDAAEHDLPHHRVQAGAPGDILVEEQQLALVSEDSSIEAELTNAV
jgi:DNA sulfur modification protein DndC